MGQKVLGPPYEIQPPSKYTASQFSSSRNFRGVHTL